jgi:hypothetical protein
MLEMLPLLQVCFFYFSEYMAFNDTCFPVDILLFLKVVGFS